VIIRVKYVEANDVLGRFRYATPDALAAGQFDHADSLEEIEQKVLDSIHVRLEHWEEEEGK
jgi:hypothetical protein